MVNASARRGQARFAVGKGLSIRRACALAEVASSALDYTSRMKEKEAELIDKPKLMPGVVLATDIDVLRLC